MCRKFDSPSSDKSPYIAAHLLSFLQTPSPLLTTLFQQYKTASEIPDEQKNELMWQSCFFIFRRLFWKNFLKIMQCCIFFYKQHQVEICSKIITISSIKRSQKKNKHSKWKTCLVKNTATTKSIERKAVLTLSPFDRLL